MKRKDKDKERLPIIQFMSAGSSGKRLTEKVMAEVGRVLEGREFSSVEEMNKFLEQVMTPEGKIPLSRERTPEEKAQDLIYDAWEMEDKKSRIRLAEQALELWPDCADAYVILAEDKAKSLEEAKEFYERGVRAGERSLGPETFEKQAGHFWGIIKTRPYMRARAGLARCLWKLGQRSEAIDHLQDMLRLNPGDNQGLRYELINWLLYEGRDKEARALLNSYKGDPTAFWLYSEALWLFRHEGPSNRANRALKEAMEENDFVPSYLLGKKKLPRHLPEAYVLGEESEAIVYADLALEVWRHTPGAREWLATSFFWFNLFPRLPLKNAGLK
ncbi:ST7 protein [Thermanaeromonas toyohensis ToBE]|uniref:ST7 protein n=1 Tax=Thermanaeromonas toyohensis ToBE TaxID=698762 RepID=A0A1W1VYB7_9FIRM|nr:hypothetical protein [Thermanaeromonas toyohensis]SMB98243.1 ST7 protein [Thermanaeromonas toyohensis ToBE]